MTAAGTAEVAFVLEDSFNGPLATDGSGNIDWYQPGVNISVTGPTIDRNQGPVRQPDSATPGAHRPGQFNGSVTVEFEVAGDTQQWEDLVFHESGGQLPSDGGVAQSFAVYVSSTIIEGSEVDLIGRGAVVTEAEISLDEGGETLVSLTIEFAAEGDSTSAPADGDITTPDPELVFPYHSGTVGTTGVDPQLLLDSATVTISNLHRLRYSFDQNAQGAVVGGIEVEVDLEGTFTETAQLDLATTGTGNGALTDATDVTFTLERPNSGTPITHTYTASNARPDSYEWGNLVEPGDDHTESVTLVAETVTTG